MSTIETARVVGPAETPTAETGLLITCDCKGHRGARAIMRDPGHPMTSDRICKLIAAAYHPLAGAASMRRLGPWQTS